MPKQCKVVRIHLKTGGSEGTVDREKLINYCLHNKDSQYVVIGWSCVYKENESSIESFDDYYKAVQYLNKIQRQENGYAYRMNPAINRFSETEENDLFWTRDIDGNYWICRAKGKAEPYCDSSLDIGARVPVEAYMFGVEVSGQIKASFNRARGGITESFYDDLIISYSQHIFNKLSDRMVYSVEKSGRDDILDNLPCFDLEELVISYIQIKENYYLLSNSIAKNSTTIKIECEFRSRDKNNPKRAVVQVKGGHSKEINAEDYKAYDNEGYNIYFFAPNVINLNKLNNGIRITREELLDFYREYRAVLPDSITKWESLFE